MTTTSFALAVVARKRPAGGAANNTGSSGRPSSLTLGPGPGPRCRLFCSFAALDVVDLFVTSPASPQGSRRGCRVTVQSKCQSY
jgi:hypothetical protein